MQCFDVSGQAMTWNFHIWGSVDKANLQREIFHSLLLLGNHWFQASENVLRVFKFVKRDQQTNWTLNLAQSSILKWRFRWSSRRSFLNFLLASLRFDDGNVNDNTTNQWFDWLNKEKQSCCTCGTLFGAMFWRSLPNDDVKFSHLRFWRQRELPAVNLSLFALSWKPFVPSKRKCSSPILYNVINTR